MADIGQISVSLTARTKKFAKDMGRGAAIVTKTSAAMANATAKAGALGGAIIGLAGAGSLGMLINRQREAIDTNVKFADSIAIDVLELTRFQHAANLTGVANEQLNKGLRQQVVNIEKANQGYGPAIAALDNLGLSAQELAKLAPERQFLAISEAVKSAKDQSMAAAAVSEIYGARNLDLINTLRLGEDGLKAVGEEADRLGASYSRVDAAKVEAANDAMDRAGKVIQGVGTTLAVKLSPLIETGAAKFQEWANSGSGAGSKVVHAMKWVGTGIAKAADFIELPVAAFHGFVGTVQAGTALQISAINSFLKSIEKAANLIPGVSIKVTESIAHLSEGFMKSSEESFKKAGAAYDNFTSGKRQRQVSDFFDKIEKSSQKAAEKVAAVAKARQATNTTVQDQIALEKQLNDEREKADALAKAQADKQQFLARILDDIKTPQEKFAETAGKIQSLLAEGLITQDQFDKAILSQRKHYGLLNDEANDLKKTTKDTLDLTSTRAMAVNLRRQAVGGLNVNSAVTARLNNSGENDRQAPEQTRLLAKIASNTKMGARA